MYYTVSWRERVSYNNLPPFQVPFSRACLHSQAPATLIIPLPPRFSMPVEAAQEKFNRFHYSLDDSPCFFGSRKELRRTPFSPPCSRSLPRAIVFASNGAGQGSWRIFRGGRPPFSFFLFLRFICPFCRLKISIPCIRGA